jgi:hypothetical protein
VVIVSARAASRVEIATSAVRDTIVDVGRATLTELDRDVR